MFKKILVFDREAPKLGPLLQSLSNSQQSPLVFECHHEAQRAIRALLDAYGEYGCILLGHESADFEMIHRLQAIVKLRIMPLIMFINAKDTQAVSTAIEAGVRYCIDPKQDIELSINMLLSAFSDFKRYLGYQHHLLNSNEQVAFFIQQASFKFRSLKEAKLLANFMAQLCPNQKLSVIGITELFINAIEHGNLAIDYGEKSKIKEECDWVEEIEKRLNLPENLNKFVLVNFDRDSEYLRLRIEDQGNGFDWKQYESIQPQRLLDKHGRGIAMAKSLSFHELSFSGKGNIAHCTIKL
ncbi:MAG: ATP-binding protein [Gammaproteobacteria bacterium]